eukprot:gb/GEZN01004229.1/.p1 GENE.gb/GEZN01004229.1/~~gb/GEZN01004229.1/.p1  ORF type:complete len:534 (+),score=64.08 gb/GEZN01004229.1/:95-1603(+)
MVIVGAGDRIVSEKRQEYLHTTVDSLEKHVIALDSSIKDIKEFQAVLELHGSGTTNPSTYFWRVMNLMQTRLQSPTKLTYRGIGSDAGKAEFIAGVNGFGSGDIPLFAADEAQLQEEKILQIPFLVGGVGVFHSAVAGMRFTPSVLAKIFSRAITRWDDPAITVLNENLKSKIPAGQAITVVNRRLGSSSTYVFTSYLKVAAPSDWTLGAGTVIVWPEGTIPVDGSGPMSDYISGHAWSIGYIDSWFGQAAGLNEASLLNQAGVYVTSLNTAGIQAAANQAIEAGLPANDASWKDVSLLNLPGETTWPLSVFSYVYVRADQTKRGERGSLLKAFFDFILSTEGQELVKEFSFVPVGEKLLSINKVGLAKMTFAPEVIPYTFEVATSPIIGAGDRVISSKRDSYERFTISTIQKHLAVLDSRLMSSEQQLTALDSNFTVLSSGQPPIPPEQSDKAMQIAIAGLIIAIGAFCLSAYNTYILQIAMRKNSDGLISVPMSRVSITS